VLKTFIVVAIVRESLPDAALESQQPQGILQDERKWARRPRQPASELRTDLRTPYTPF
jgi:hypothetical protein